MHHDLPIWLGTALVLVLTAACSNDNGSQGNCDGITCSEHGRCAELDVGRACVCDVGYGPIGDECIPCADIDLNDDPTIDVPMLTFAGQFFINGEVAPGSIYENGEIWLQNPTSGRVLIGQTREQSFEVQMIPGTYEVVYSRKLGGGAVPGNSWAVFDTIEIYEPTDFGVIDIPMTTLSGSFQLNGAAFPASIYNRGELFLVNVETEDEVSLGETHEGSYSIKVIPGTYGVRYRHLTGNSVPVNTNADLGTHEVGSGSDTFDIGVTAATLGGTFLVNGGTPVASIYESGAIKLARGDDEVALGFTHQGSYAGVKAVVGDYDIVYSLQTGGSQVPVNERGVIGMTSVAQGTTTVNVNVLASNVSRRVLFGGVLAPVSYYEHGAVVLETEAGDRADLGRTYDQVVAGLVVHGDYQMFYEKKLGGSQVPSNGHAFVQNLTVDQTSSDVVDIPVTVLTGDYSINGAPAPVSEYEDGNVFLRNGADSLELGNTHDGSYEARVVPEIFQVVYELEHGGSSVPTNSAAVVGMVEVAGANASYDVEIGRSQSDGDFTLNGQTPPMGLYATGQVSARDAAGGTVVGLTNLHTYSVAVVPGVYDLYYDALNDFPGIPRNEDTRLGCFAAP